MKYENKTKRETRLETQKRLANLWAKCDTFEEFDLKASTDIPEASRRDLRTCRLYWFKKTHPAMYRLSLVGTLAGVGFACGLVVFCASGFSANPWPSALAWLFGSAIAFLTHIVMHREFMSILAWYEETNRIEQRCIARFRFYDDIS